ncbi:MAG: hypothetical protein ACR2KJ_09575 [Jatrophihabitans sp.]
MALLGKRPPAEARKLLDRSEHIVTWADTSGGVPLIVTNLGLWWPEDTGPRRISWALVDKAVWSEDTLTVTEAEVQDDLLLVEQVPKSVTLAQPRTVPPAVRKRVEFTVAQRHEVLVSGRPVRIVARRVPGQDGLKWWARLPDDLPDGPTVRAELAAAIERLRGAEADPTL